MIVVKQLRIPVLGRAIGPGYALGLTLALALGLLAPLSGPPGSGLPERPVGGSEEAYAAAMGATVGGPEGYVYVEAVKKRDKCEANPGGGSTSPLVERWRLPAAGLAYVVNTASVPGYLPADGVALAAQQAAAAWVIQGAPPLVHGGATTASGTMGDGVNTIGFGRAPEAAASVAVVRVVNGVVVEADIVLDATNPWSLNPGAAGECGGEKDKWDVQNALSHEFGHWIGAKHTPDDSEYKHRTMYPEIGPGELKKRLPAAGDIASIPGPSTAPSDYTGIVTRAGDDDGGP